MNKVIIALLMLLVVGMVIGEEASQGEKEDYTEEELKNTPPDEWDMDRISEENYKMLKKNVNGLGKSQLNNLDKDQLGAVMSNIDSRRLDKLNNNQISKLDSDDAKEYFEGKLGEENDYNPQNSNERALLKKLKKDGKKIYSKVDMQSLATTDGVGFGKDNVGNYVKTPNGKVYLEEPAKIEQTEQGIVVDDTVRLTKGDLTVHEDGYDMGLFSKCDLMQDSDYTGVSLDTTSHDGAAVPEAPKIYKGDPEEKRDNYVSFDKDSLKVGGSGYTLVTHEKNNFKTFSAEPKNSGFSIQYPEEGIEANANSGYLDYLRDPDSDIQESMKKDFEALPFETKRLTVTKNDDETTIVKKPDSEWEVEDGGGWGTSIVEGIKGVGDSVNDAVKDALDMEGVQEPLTQEKANEKTKEWKEQYDDPLIPDEIMNGRVSDYIHGRKPEELNKIKNSPTFDKLPEQAQKRINDKLGNKELEEEIMDDHKKG